MKPRTALVGGVVVALVQVVVLFPHRAAAASAIGAAAAPVAVARRSDDNVREAAKHFQRGVTLYGEADYRGALVEFTRAYELAPNGAVLYNVGETQYQLRDYAAALITFQRYLTESGLGDSHRAEVEGNVRELKSRVGRLTVETVPRGAEVSIDDRVVGKTPLDQPVTVGLGHLKVTATISGRPSVTRYVDVAAEDDVSVTLQLPAAALGRAPGPSASGSTGVDGSATPGGASLRPLGWVATGLLAGAAVTFGFLAHKESSDLQSERAIYGASSDTLNQKANRTRTYAIVTDSLTAAALIVGGITLYSTLGAHADPGGAQVSVGLGAMRLEVAF
jgi:hypothetical protein